MSAPNDPRIAEALAALRADGATNYERVQAAGLILSGAPSAMCLLPDTDAVVDALLALDPGPPACAAAAIAAYADRVTETTGMWPPVARATACHEGLRLIAAELRRGPAAGTTEEEIAV